jgi:hypothetical protein
MTDRELARALERGDVPNEGFHHADHLRVALVYLNESPSIDAAVERMASTLRRFAASVGKPEKYSQPTTEFWIYQMAAARAVMPSADCDADAVFAACPRLLDKHLILAYYSTDAAATGSPDSPGDAPDRALPRRSA